MTNCTDGFDDACGIGVMESTLVDTCESDIIQYGHDFMGKNDVSESVGLYIVDERVGHDVIFCTETTSGYLDDAMVSEQCSSRHLEVALVNGISVLPTDLQIRTIICPCHINRDAQIYKYRWCR